MDDMRPPDITDDPALQLLVIRVRGAYSPLGMRRALLSALLDERLLYAVRLLWDMLGTTVDFGAADAWALVQLAVTVANQPQMRRVAIVTDSPVLFDFARRTQSLLSWTRADVARAVFADLHDATRWLCSEEAGEHQTGVPP
jgi:hypothetical protein